MTMRHGHTLMGALVGALALGAALQPATAQDTTGQTGQYGQDTLQDTTGQDTTGQDTTWQDTSRQDTSRVGQDTTDMPKMPGQGGAVDTAGYSGMERQDTSRAGQDTSRMRRTGEDTLSDTSDTSAAGEKWGYPVDTTGARNPSGYGDTTRSAGASDTGARAGHGRAHHQAKMKSKSRDTSKSSRDST